ncbi:Ig-like domain-containing protein [Chlorobium ferrooxidans]|uniref:Hemolysin-type calcium-binding region:Peptidase M10A and M12B, matrixin and adamalysin n=1 Tax=Chlorobium ferrooxidans DSM 13031 TaxID=377431 RepID=Q0YQV5_9CHLB|nr:Ig-like domain-containing protein [Chlorobium ferrooxidans]EAT58714.1 Hemolysin-type calcium-binding region:Peptidase M10A and M12B, matrixin and adamalysin [Chlorobium ferrooxidans DSM 13031]
MPTPFTSSATTTFSLSGLTTLDALLSTELQKWSAGSNSSVSLSYSFPWTTNSTPVWQAEYSDMLEQEASEHFGLTAAQIAEVNHALQTWADVALLNFTEVADDPDSVGDFRLAFSSAVDGYWGWCYFPDSTWASAGDVWINPLFATGSSWTSGSFNYYSLIHETGHGLGLKHPGNYSEGSSSTEIYFPASLDYRNYSVMSYNDFQTWFFDTSLQEYIAVVPETPMVYDIEAIQYLYGTNNNYRTGNTTYTFDPATPFYKSIWDSGGTDTIDISNFSTDCTIDLTPGSYSTLHYINTGTRSDLYDGSNNLGIAFGVTLEMVNGGSGNDTIKGNRAGNSLYGGSGNDTVTGGAGDDILNGGDGTDKAVYSGNFSDYSISYDGATDTYTITDKSADRDGSDRVSGFEQFQFADAVKADILVPTVTQFSPADGAVNAGNWDDIVITFSEVIQKGSGTVAIHLGSATGSLLEPAYDVSTSTNLTISESRLTIKPDLSFAFSTHYFVTFDTGSITDREGNSPDGLQSYDFTTADPYIDNSGGSGAGPVLAGVGSIAILAWVIL